MLNVFSQAIEIPRIGLVLFEKSKRAKRLNISITPPARIRIAIPKGVTLQKAVDFLKNKEPWINKTINQIQTHSIQQNQCKHINKEYATNHLLTRLDELARIHGLMYNRVAIRNQKTRWGSCSEKNNINLNIQLINLPKQLIDYVILHELVHTLVKNHSVLFWDTLEKFVEYPRNLDKQLKTYYLF